MAADLTGTLQAILDQLESHALSLGRFERVNLHEPKASPGSGVTLAIWADYIGPRPAGSGLASTSGLIVFQARAYTNMLTDPPDSIDPNLTGAVGMLIGSYSADFDLGGQVMAVDLLGQSQRRLEAQAGYLNQDGKLFRVMTVTLPLLVNDLWPQGA